MYGVMNTVTQEWIPGVFSEIWKKSNLKTNKHMSWIVCDGPVDAIWIENLNTVLDDNKILTLANAERIPMSDNCKMVFEVRDLDNASPATVSRCGIIYVSEEDLYWKPLTVTWCMDRELSKPQKCCNPEEKNWVTHCCKNYIEAGDMFKIIARDYHQCMNTYPVIMITQLLNLLWACLEKYESADVKIDKATFEKYWIYCQAWSCGGLFEQEDREKFHAYLASRGAPLPNIQSTKPGEKETIFDYHVDAETSQWKLWEAEGWTPPKRIAFSQLLIPTSDSTRTEFVVDSIANLPTWRSPIEMISEPGLKNTLLLGGPGTAKTSVLMMYAAKFDTEKMVFKRINFSSATLPFDFQESVEAELDRKQARLYCPPQNKWMTVFMDDMSMPFVNDWGDQITLEIVR